VDKRECINLIKQHFEIQSSVASLKNPDFELKSHIFFYNNLFKEVNEIRILRVKSKNAKDNIMFDIYYVSDEFEGLFHGYFRIKTESDSANKIFEDVSKMCTDLSEYMYYVYQNSELLKIYLISLDIQSSLEQCDMQNDAGGFEDIKKSIYKEIADYDQIELSSSILDRRFNKKNIYNFIVFNSKCSEIVKMFLLNLLSNKYSNNICMVNWKSKFKNYIYVNSNSIYFNGNKQLSVFSLLDSAVLGSFVMFVKFDFDFEGGVNSGKTINKR